jgi:branched-chain amino acid transport system ATP-binding protein
MLLEIRSLTIAYGKARALDSLDLEARQGEIVGLIGPNGAGKTTTLRAVSGLVPKISGSVLLGDDDISGLPPEEIVKLGVAHCPEGGQIFPGMTVLENLQIGAYVRRGDVSEDLAYVLSLFPVLKDRRGQIAGRLSGGEQIMLSIGRGLMLSPRLLLIDEPTLGLAPMICMELGRKLREIAERMTALLLVEQNAQLAFGISDRCYVLEHGKVVLHGQTGIIQQDPHVRKAYLGL